MLAFKFYTGVWLNFSLNFSLEPWAKVSDGVCCPFFPMKEAVVECPSCGAVVSKDALHKVRISIYKLRTACAAWLDAADSERNTIQ